MSGDLSEMRVFGQSTAQVRGNTQADSYALRNFLLKGKRVTCEIARLQLGIGGSALPRRILDLKRYLDMKIEARWRTYMRTDGKKTHVREYWIEEEHIAHFCACCMEKTIHYPSRSRNLAHAAGKNPSAQKNLSPAPLHAVDGSRNQEKAESAFP